MRQPFYCRFGYEDSKQKEDCEFLLCLGKSSFLDPRFKQDYLQPALLDKVKSQLIQELEGLPEISKSSTGTTCYCVSVQSLNSCLLRE